MALGRYLLVTPAIILAFCLVYLGYITLSKQWQDCFQNVLIEKTVSVTFEMSATALVGMTTYYLSATFQPLKPLRLF